MSFDPGPYTDMFTTHTVLNECQLSCELNALYDYQSVHLFLLQCRSHPLGSSGPTWRAGSHCLYTQAQPSLCQEGIIMVGGASLCEYCTRNTRNPVGYDKSADNTAFVLVKSSLFRAQNHKPCLPRRAFITSSTVLRPLNRVT